MSRCLLTLEEDRRVDAAVKARRAVCIDCDGIALGACHCEVARAVSPLGGEPMIGHAHGPAEIARLLGEVTA